MNQIQTLHASINDIELRLKALESMIEDETSTDKEVAYCMIKMSKLESDLTESINQLKKLTTWKS